MEASATNVPMQAQQHSTAQKLRIAMLCVRLLRLCAFILSQWLNQALSDAVELIVMDTKHTGERGTTWLETEGRSSPLSDRRSTPRGGRRYFDLPHAISCPSCANKDVRGLGHGISGLWCECRSCRYVWPE